MRALDRAETHSGLQPAIQLCRSGLAPALRPCPEDALRFCNSLQAWTSLLSEAQTILDVASSIDFETLALERTGAIKRFGVTIDRISPVIEDIRSGS